MNTRKIAPGPRGDLLLGNLRAFRRDVLGLMLESARDYGDVIRFHLGPFVVHLVNHPDHVEHVLRSHGLPMTVRATPLPGRLNPGGGGRFLRRVLRRSKLV